MRDQPSLETTKVISVREAGAQLGLGRNGAYQAAHRGEIPTIKIGRRLFVPRDAIDKLLARAIDSVATR